MTDLLVRDVPEHVVAVIDRKAKRLGLSRTEFLRRHITRAATGAGEPVSVDDLRDFADHFADLADPDVMRQAWR